MANELKKVGLIFTEKGAVDFKKTLQEVNLELNKNYNQFKLTQAQWDKTTTSTEKLKAQQEYLTSAMEAQADKVSILKMQLAELEGAENKNTTAIKKKRAELLNAELKLEDYKNKVKEVEARLTSFGKKAEESGEKIQKLGGNIEKAGKKVSAFSAATGAALVASAKSAIDFETAFTGVEKTVDGTAEQMAELKQGIRDMAKEIPSSTTEISAVAEAAGQLGIKTEDILSFTRVMIDLGNSTNLGAEEAASALAKFANITKMSAKDYDKLGSTIVALGNNFATTEADIVSMATRLAATGELAGLGQSQILSLATAMSSVGIEAEAGGSAMSKLLKKMQVATETGSKDLKEFAKVAGMSASEFKQAYQKDAVKALSAFISGLKDTKRNGKSAIAILEDMGLKEVRLSNTILSLTNASELLNEAVELGNDAWEDNTALTNEANKRYGTMESKIKIASNKFKDLGVTIGNKLLPTIDKGIGFIDKITKKIEKLSDKDIDLIVNIAKVVAAIGPLLIITGKITTAGGTAIKTIGTITQAIGVMRGTVTSSSTAVNGLAGVMKGLVSPTGLATAAILGIAAAAIYFKNSQTEAQKYAKELNEQIQESKKSMDDYNKSIDDTTSSELGHMARIEALKGELDLIVDENGKVKDGYKKRADFILTELNEALGKEYSMNGDIIQSYKDISKEIDKTIEKKKADIVLAGEAQKWEAAHNDQQQALIDQNTAYHALEDAARKYGVSVEDLRKQTEDWHNEAAKWKEGSGLEQLYRSMTNPLPEILNKYTDKDIKEIENLLNAHDTATERIKQNTESMISYNDKLDAYVKEDYESVVSTVKTSTKDWTDYSLQKLKESIQKEGQELKDYTHSVNTTHAELAEQRKKMAEENLQSIADELVVRTNTIHELSGDEIEAWKTLANESNEAYQKGISQMDPEMRQKIVDVTGVIYNETPNVTNAMDLLSDEMIEQIKNNDEFRATAISNLQSFLNGLDDQGLRNLLYQAGVEDVDKVMQGIRSGNLAESEGISILQGLQRGLQNNYANQGLVNIARSVSGTISRILGGANVNIGALPGHKTGLEYVPKDNYVARLHKGERVLTAEENKEYTDAEETAKKQNHNSGVIQTVDYDKLASACNSGNARIESLLTRLIDVTGKMKIVLDSGVLVGETAQQMDEELGRLSDKKARGN